MHVVLIATDKPDALQVRLDNREAHLAYVAETGVVELAGPFIDAEGRMTGSMILLDVPDMAAAQAWAADDPYARAGLFSEVTLRTWKKVIG
ncbi:MAG: YciI family protein [Limimaricola sp.]|uniref:YciI family protein n=1 Tax=Limimaricola sp. TaxID=2211665 RepID=UPI001E076B7C|nr:YciI family protein [Limimaricola sp.]MBI1417250.1 YciI family protein [Limimaricola sp.]